jgi:hypothetical protein
MFSRDAANPRCAEEVARGGAGVTDRLWDAEDVIRFVAE